MVQDTAEWLSGPRCARAVPARSIVAGAGEVTFVLVDEDFQSSPLPDAVRDCVVEHGDGLAPDS